MISQRNSHRSSPKLFYKWNRFWRMSSDTVKSFKKGILKFFSMAYIFVMAINFQLKFRVILCIRQHCIIRLLMSVFWLFGHFKWEYSRKLIDFFEWISTALKKVWLMTLHLHCSILIRFHNGKISLDLFVSNEFENL